MAAAAPAREPARPTRAAPAPASGGLRPAASPFGAGVPAPVLRRCACGGGCPSCRAAKASSPALPINTPGDAFEREADAAAAAVMSGGLAGAGRGAPPALRRCACGGGCPSCRAPREEELRRDDAGARTAPGYAPPAVHDVLASPGQPLDAGARGFMEARFGADFGGVRVHADAPAAESARAVDAHAYTVGSHVVFGAGEYAPATEGGRRLLAHELAHVVQQRGGVRRLQRAVTRGAGGCGPATVVDEDLEGARGAGSAAHRQIQSFLLSSGILGEIEIPRASKRRMANTACQPPGSSEGYADLVRLGPMVGISEIKPFGFALRYGVRQAEHYVRRAGQSIDRFLGSGVGPGNCGALPAGDDDRDFARFVRQTAGGPRHAFGKLDGILGTDTIIGPFDGDRSRTLKARQAAPGAVGYWCTGGASDTYTCGVSQRETDEYLDRMLLPAQDALDRFLRDTVERRLDQAIDQMDLATVFAAANRVAGAQINRALGPYFSTLASVLPGGASLSSLGSLVAGQIGPEARAMLRVIARRVKSMILNELRVRLRTVLRTMLQEALVALCVGAPVVTLAQLFERMEEELRRRVRLLIPVVVAAVARQIAAELLRQMGQMLADMMAALGRALRWVLNIVLRILAVVAILLLVVGALALLILAVAAVFDPVPGDELALFGASAAVAALIPVLGTYVTTGELPDEGA